MYVWDGLLTQPSTWWWCGKWEDFSSHSTKSETEERKMEENFHLQKEFYSTHRIAAKIFWFACLFVGKSNLRCVTFTRLTHILSTLNSSNHHFSQWITLSLFIATSFVYMTLGFFFIRKCFQAILEVSKVEKGVEGEKLKVIIIHNQLIRRKSCFCSSLLSFLNFLLKIKSYNDSFLKSSTIFFLFQTLLNSVSLEKKTNYFRISDEAIN